MAVEEDGSNAGRDPYDPAKRVLDFMMWLDRFGIDAIPTTMPPPIDHGALIGARAEAERIAMGSGRIDDLHRYRQAIVDWALNVFRRYGLSSIYFMGHSAPAEVKVEAVEVLTDAMAGYLLADLLPEEVAATLFARFDVMLGGHIFPVEPEPS